MDLLIIGLGFVVIVAIAGALIFYALQSQRASAIDDRLSQFTETAMSLEDMELQRPFHERVLLPIAQSILAVLGKLSPQRGAEEAKKKLQQAGNPGGLTPIMFSGIRLALAAFLGLLVGFITLTSMETMTALFYTAIMVMLGYLLPSFWLGMQIGKRKKSILKALPDALDLLTISVEAGLGFDVALQRVTEKWDDELSREFKRVLADIRLGRSRREALRDLGDRNEVEDLQTFVSAIIQADQLGVSMSKILRLQSDQMRLRRRQRAEAEAQKAPVKMLFPMVFLIFPALFVVILGPAIPRIMDGFGGINEDEPEPTPEPGALLDVAEPVADADIFHSPQRFAHVSPAAVAVSAAPENVQPMAATPQAGVSTAAASLSYEDGGATLLREHRTGH